MKNEMKEIQDSTIEFYAPATRIDALPPPVPAQKAMPEWWLKAQRSLKPNEVIWEDGLPSGGTFKKCQPFTDAMRTGYIIPLWQDFSYGLENDDENSPQFLMNWNRGRYPYFETEPSRDGALEVPITRKNWDSWKEIEGVEDGICYDASFSFTNPWIIRTPPGYSCYFTSPVNGEDPRFRLFTGVVNTDTYFNNINFFFGMRKDAPRQGLFKKGMPLVQVIPFKREEWTVVTKKIEIDSPEFNQRMNVIAGISSHIEGGYKKHYGCPVVFK